MAAGAGAAAGTGDGVAAAGDRGTGEGGFAEFEVLVHAARQGADLAVAQERHLVVGDALQQVAVVADHHERARPAVQDVFDGGEGVGVEVVGGLVEHQHVRLPHQQAQQLEAAAFATGEVLDRGPLLLVGEAKLLHELAGGEFLAADVEGALFALDDLDHAQVRDVVELLDFLGQHRGDHRLAALDLARRSAGSRR